MNDHRYWSKGFSDSPARPTATHYFAKFAATVYLGLVRALFFALSSLIRKRQYELPNSKKLTIFAVGPFFSENWSMAHMEALCKADLVGDVYLFTPTPYKDTANLHYVTHSQRHSAWFGDGIARILNAWQLAKKIKPDLIIGYHLPWNGLMALLISARAGSAAAYFSVGGPPELIGGGIYSEHALFSKLAIEDRYIEKILVGFLSNFDLILTMGTRSQDFFESIVGDVPVVPIAVGINDSRFSQKSSGDRSNSEFDLISVGRLSAIKQTDRFLQIVAKVHENFTTIRAAVVGDGEEMENLQNLAKEVDILDRVHFLGWSDKVETELRHSKLFIMTSSSEGLPHSLIEAMLTGTPAIVPDIGEISDLVEDGLNGYLLKENSTDDFVDRINGLLADPGLLEQYSRNARNSALRYTVRSRVVVWNKTLKELRSNDDKTQSTNAP